MHAVRKPTTTKLEFDTHVLDTYLTGLQAEVEAKLRRVTKFREQMQKLDSAGRKTDRAARVRAARALIDQVHDMMETNVIVRETLQQLLKAAQAVLRDVEELPD